MRRARLIAFCGLSLSLVLACAPDDGGEAQAPAPGFRSPITQVTAPRTAQAMRELFDAHDYALAPVRASGVAPRIYVHSIPLDLAKVSEVHEKKSLFIRMLLPLVLKANEEILAQRTRLQALHGRGELAEEDRAWLSQLATRYGASPGDTSELLLRVDAIPPSLALAQGIDESGWGTSHFARADEALFGQHAPKGAPDAVAATGAKGVAVAGFSALLDSVQAYLLNLNSGHAYHALRERRAEIAASGRQASGPELVGALVHYSERGAAYVENLRSIIEANALHELDAAALEATGGSLLVLPGD